MYCSEKYMAKVSMLVPIYNVSDYIERCVCSLFEQTFDDIEYIFVNDCTPDDSMVKLEKIVRRYPHRKNRVNIITHKSNLGPGVARETALLAATGEYVCCVDSDDYIDADMVQCLYRKAVIEQADIVVSDRQFEYADKIEVTNYVVSTDKEENFANMLDCEHNSPFLCSKMIRRTLWLESNAFVPQGMGYCEDWFVVSRLYFYAKKIVKVNKAFYHYVCTNVHSITFQRNESHLSDIILFWKTMDVFLENHGALEKYKKVTDLSKVLLKVRFMVEVNSYALLKKYGFLFHDVELKYIGSRRLRRGEKVTLILLHFKLYVVAYCFLLLLHLKNRNS